MQKSQNILNIVIFVVKSLNKISICIIKRNINIYLFTFASLKAATYALRILKYKEQNDEPIFFNALSGKSNNN